MADEMPSAQILHAAYPLLTPDAALELSTDKSFVEYAKDLASKNPLTHRLIVGFDKPDFLSFFYELPEDLSGVFNPCYRTKVKDFDEPITYLERCAETADFNTISNYLKDISPKDVQPYCLKTVLNAALFLPQLRESLFVTKADVLKPYQNIYDKPDQREILKRIRAKRSGLDNFISQVAKKFPDELVPLLMQMFETPKSGKIDLNTAYLFHKQQTKEHTVFSFLLEAKMPQTAICLLDAIKKEKGVDGVVALLQGEATNQEFSAVPYYQALKAGDKETNTVFQVKKHLEDILPSNLFLEKVEFKKSPYQWNRDFANDER